MKLSLPTEQGRLGKRALFGIVLASLLLLLVVARATDIPRRIAQVADTAPATAARAVTLPFFYNFNSDGTLHEAGAMTESTSPYWWLNAGGKLIIADGRGGTITGELPTFDRWRIAYGLANPADTDGGYHPQNIFRLLSRTQWKDVSSEVRFSVTGDNQSSSQNRNESNGVLLMARYADGDNLYYAGLRVDGALVIKKKKNGRYYTLAYEKILPGTYDRSVAPNLIPKDVWSGLRMSVRNSGEQSVEIRLFTDLDGRGQWALGLQATDDGVSYGGAVHRAAGYVGIRSDFMDVAFDDFWIREG